MVRIMDKPEGVVLGTRAQVNPYKWKAADLYNDKNLLDLR